MDVGRYSRMQHQMETCGGMDNWKKVPTPGWVPMNAPGEDGFKGLIHTFNTIPKGMQLYFSPYSAESMEADNEAYPIMGHGLALTHSGNPMSVWADKEGV